MTCRTCKILVQRWPIHTLLVVPPGAGCTSNLKEINTFRQCILWQGLFFYTKQQNVLPNQCGGPFHGLNDPHIDGRALPDHLLKTCQLNSQYSQQWNVPWSCFMHTYLNSEWGLRLSIPSFGWSPPCGQGIPLLPLSEAARPPSIKFGVISWLFGQKWKE